MNRSESFTAFVDRAGGMGLVAHSTVHLTTPLSLLARFEGAAQWRRMHSEHRPALCVTGAVHLPWLQAEVTFRRHAGAGEPRPGERRSSTVVVPGDLPLPIPPQSLDVEPVTGQAPVLRAAPHVPWVDRRGVDAESDSIPLRAQVVLDATLDARFTPKQRTWSREVVVGFTGEIRFDQSVRASLMFATPGSSQALACEPDAKIIMVAAGTHVPIPYRGVSGLFVPNPWISVRFLDAKGRLAGREHDLGRSVRVT